MIIIIMMQDVVRYGAQDGPLGGPSAHFACGKKACERTAVFISGDAEFRPRFPPAVANRLRLTCSYRGDSGTRVRPVALRAHACTKPDATLTGCGLGAPRARPSPAGPVRRSRSPRTTSTATTCGPANASASAEPHARRPAGNKHGYGAAHHREASVATRGSDCPAAIRRYWRI